LASRERPLALERQASHGGEPRLLTPRGGGLQGRRRASRGSEADLLTPRDRPLHPKRRASCAQETGLSTPKRAGLATKAFRRSAPFGLRWARCWRGASPTNACCMRPGSVTWRSRHRSGRLWMSWPCCKLARQRLGPAVDDQRSLPWLRRALPRGASGPLTSRPSRAGQLEIEVPQRRHLRASSPWQSRPGGDH
jgi:hypothetical protein